MKEGRLARALEELACVRQLQTNRKPPLGRLRVAASGQCHRTGWMTRGATSPAAILFVGMPVLHEQMVVAASPVLKRH